MDADGAGGMADNAEGAAMEMIQVDSKYLIAY
jgi:hypothetical protein